MPMQMMLQHRIIHFSLYYLLSGRLGEAINKSKFQTFRSKTGSLSLARGGRLQYVPDRVIFGILKIGHRSLSFSRLFPLTAPHSE